MSDATDIDELRDHLDDLEGPAFWRGLEELAGSETFREYLHCEFPREAATWGPDLDRRDFLQLSAASLAMVGLAGCEPEERERIIPYVEQPEELVPGEPLFYASTLSFSGWGQGVLVESHTGRPTKIEGNPDHPVSTGTTTAHTQASILSLYDPDRSQVVRHDGTAASWQQFRTEMQSRVQRLEATDGSRCCVLTGTLTSPTLGAQLEALFDRYPEASWCRFEPVGRRRTRRGARRAFGRDLAPRIAFDRTEVVASFDADFLGAGPGQLAASRLYADARRVRDGTEPGQMNRLYVVESAPSLTGANADHRRALRPHQVERILRAVGARLEVDGVEAPADLPVEGEWIDALVTDLADRPSAVTVGEPQPPRVHALGHAINARLDNLGRTVRLLEPVDARPTDPIEFSQLADRLEAGEIGTLLIVGANPAYTAPSDIPFADLLGEADLSVHLGRYRDETARQCNWHIPRSHPLESWSDRRAWDGTASIVQPIIDPLYNTWTAHDVLAQLLGEPETTSRERVRDYWESRWETHRPGESFETGWKRSLEAGLVPGTGRRHVDASLREEFTPEAPPDPAGEADGGPLTVVFRPDPSVWDGRFANNGWLQELPKPLTSLTWDNAALMAPETAERLGVNDETVVELAVDEQTVRAPVKVLSGHPADTVTCRLGYGREAAGRVGDGVGFDAYRLRSSDARWSGRGLQVRPTGDSSLLATTQHHHSMEGRDIVQVETVEQFVDDGDIEDPPQKSLHPEWEYEDDYQWAMVIDQTVCTGCKACVLACQAENNIPIVGKRQVARGREMHWLRVDNYFAGDLDDPEVFFQPVPCMHCEKAPCEVVCPVAATTHSDEGVNEMTYNRCIGTRYCSNNCPYKVRRFNFLDYEDREEVAELQYNPDVTVRDRGVMEKCTYCIQRINDARREANAEDRRIRGDEIDTACQAACPTGAIVFGDQNNPDSRVADLKDQSHEYSLLAELSTQPRTTYLAAIRNPHPDLEFQADRAESLPHGAEHDEAGAAGEHGDHDHGGE